MRYEDAIQVIEDICFDCKHLVLCEYCAKDTIKDALNKQISKKPLDKKHFTDFLSVGFCPCCGEGTNEEMKFCSECGQMLDWSEEE